MERNRRSEAIVLANRRFRELHRIVTLFSYDEGIFEAIVYGAQKGKLAGAIEPFVIGSFFLYDNRSKGFNSISDVELIWEPVLLKSDLRRLYIANALSEIVMKMDGGDYQSIYTLLYSSLALLDKKECDPQLLFIQFVWRFITIMGLLDSLEQCPVCQKVYAKEEILSFNTTLHTPTCPTCSDLPSDAYEMFLGKGARFYLTFTQELPLERAVEVNVSQQATKRLFRYMLLYIEQILGRKLTSVVGSLFG